MVSAATAALRYKEITTKTHKGLHNKFSEIFIKSGEIEAEQGRKFRYAEDIRNKVDYDSFETITKEQAELILEDTEAFIDAVEIIIKSSTNK